MNTDPIIRLHNPVLAPAVQRGLGKSPKPGLRNARSACREGAAPSPTTINTIDKKDARLFSRATARAKAAPEPSQPNHKRGIADQHPANPNAEMIVLADQGDWTGHASHIHHLPAVHCGKRRPQENRPAARNQKSRQRPESNSTLVQFPPEEDAICGSYPCLNRPFPDTRSMCRDSR